jgi:hypothetical protein
MDKDTFKKQEQELRDILNEWDVLGVVDATYEGVFDEYDDLNHWVLSLLHKGGNEEEIRNFLKRALKEHYGLPLEPTGLEPTVKKISAWWGKYK